jgi:hypothetical protein
MRRVWLRLPGARGFRGLVGIHVDLNPILLAGWRRPRLQRGPSGLETGSTWNTTPGRAAGRSTSRPDSCTTAHALRRNDWHGPEDPTCHRGGCGPSVSGAAVHASRRETADSECREPRHAAAGGGRWRDPDALLFAHLVASARAPSGRRTVCLPGVIARRSGCPSGLRSIRSGAGSKLWRLESICAMAQPLRQGGLRAFHVEHPTVGRSLSRCAGRSPGARGAQRRASREAQRVSAYPWRSR